MLSMVMNACYTLWVPSNNAKEKALGVRDSYMVGKSLVSNLQMWDIDTAADTLKFSFF